MFQYELHLLLSSHQNDTGTQYHKKTLKYQKNKTINITSIIFCWIRWKSLCLLKEHTKFFLFG